MSICMLSGALEALIHQETKFVETINAPKLPVSGVLHDATMGTVVNYHNGKIAGLEIAKRMVDSMLEAENNE